jgi:predicted nucleic acid-binding protein
MTSSLIDTNIILDIVSLDQSWSKWSAEKLRRLGNEGAMFINQIVYAEASTNFFRREEFDQLMANSRIDREALPFDAAFEAGKAQAEYRQRGGVRERTLPDFLIGAHALVKGYRLLTRDARRYRAHFPELDIIAPDTHP